MTNPLLKVTLIVLSLVSSIMVGQAWLSSEPESPDTVQALSVETLALEEHGFESVSKQMPAADTLSNQEPQSNPSHQGLTSSQQSRRSFSFHYLDILEWMFAGRSDKTKRQPPQRPSTTLNAW